MDKQKRINYVNIAVLGAFVIAVAVRFFGKYFLPEILSTNYYLDFLFSALIFFLPFILYFVLTKTNPIKEISFKKIRIGDVFLSILFAILIGPVLTFFNAVSLLFFKAPITNTLYEVPNQMPFICAVVLIALLPALFEETAYRGVVLQNYRKSGKWIAVLLSALLFGLLHGNMNQCTYTIVLGICAAFLFEASGSIVAPMIVHFWINSKSIFSIYVLTPAIYKISRSVIEFEESYYTQIGKEELWEQLALEVPETYEEYIAQTLQASQEQGGNIVTVFLVLPFAVAAAVLAFLVLRTIAKRNKRWKALKADFFTSEASAENTEVAVNGTEKTETPEISENNDVKILTVPLMLAIAIGVISIFVYETLMLLPRK